MQHVALVSLLYTKTSEFWYIPYKPGVHISSNNFPEMYHTSFAPPYVKIPKFPVSLPAVVLMDIVPWPLAQWLVVRVDRRIVG